MIAWWLETVLIGDPVDSDDLSFRRRVRVRSARNDAGIFGFGSDLFQVAALLNLDAIASLEAEMNIRNILFSQLKILSENKRPTAGCCIRERCECESVCLQQQHLTAVTGG